MSSFDFTDIVRDEIFQNLSYKEMLHFCATNKSFSTLCQDPSLWKFLLKRDFDFTSFYPDDDPKEIYRLLERRRMIIKKPIVYRSIPDMVPDFASRFYPILRRKRIDLRSIYEHDSIKEVSQIYWDVKNNRISEQDLTNIITLYQSIEQYMSQIITERLAPYIDVDDWSDWAFQEFLIKRFPESLFASNNQKDLEDWVTAETIIWERGLE